MKEQNSPAADEWHRLFAVLVDQRPEEVGRVVLGIDLMGRYYLDRQLIAREDAPGLLRAVFAARPQDKVLFLEADRGLPYREVRRAMRVAWDAGARVEVLDAGGSGGGR